MSIRACRACALNLRPPPTSLRYVPLDENQQRLQRAEAKCNIKAIHTDKTTRQPVAVDQRRPEIGHYAVVPVSFVNEAGRFMWKTLSRVFWMISRSQVRVLRWSIFVMAKGLFPRAWVKKSFYFQVMSLFDKCSVKRISVRCCGFRLTVSLCKMGSSWCHIRLTAASKHVLALSVWYALMDHLRNVGARKTLSWQSFCWYGDELSRVKAHHCECV